MGFSYPSALPPSVTELVFPVTGEKKEDFFFQEAKTNNIYCFKTILPLHKWIHLNFLNRVRNTLKKMICFALSGVVPSVWDLVYFSLQSSG